MRTSNGTEAHSAMSMKGHVLLQYPVKNVKTPSAVLSLLEIWNRNVKAIAQFQQKTLEVVGPVRLSTSHTYQAKEYNRP